MPAFVALLRAVNVGGTGKLAMADLRVICERQGYKNVRTYIASGNVVFQCDSTEAAIKSELHKALSAHAGRAMGVIVRTGAEMANALAANPFPSAAPNRTVAIFLDAPPPPGWAEATSGCRTEQLELRGRELYVHYGDGMADTKLRIPAAVSGTARNMNTVAKLAELSAA